MISSPQTVAPKPAAMPPAAPPTPCAGTAGTGPSFAQILTEQAPPPTQSAQPAEHAAQDAAPEPMTAQAQAPAAQTRKPSASAAPAQAKPANREPDAPAQAKPAEATAVAKDGKGGKDDQHSDDDKPETQGLDELTQLIGMASGQQHAPPPTAPEAAAAHAGAHHGTAHTTTGKGDDDGRATGARKVDAQTPQPAKPADEAPSKALHADATQAVATANASSTPHVAAPDAALPSFAAALAQALPAASGQPSDGASATYSAQVQAPLHSQAFAPELGARVSLLAVDGVQQAELQLNPAGMGPVAVQIVVDGSQAQVSFHAAQAETRQALEQSLPDLAAALQGQGLTLSGGGVFQQSSRDQGAGRDAGSERGSPTGRSAGAGRAVAGTSTLTAAPARRTVGLLDTFA